MSKIRISELINESSSSINFVQAGNIVHSGFGGRTLTECVTDAKNHIKSAELLQLAYLGQILIGFAMYQHLPNHGLYLNGIVVDRANHTRGIGTEMVGRAIESTDPTYMVAITRNPAIYRLMKETCKLVRPLTGSIDPSVNSTNGIASIIGCPADTLPYHRGRYPVDLYDVQPRHKNPGVQEEFNYAFDLNDQADAIILEGLL